MKAHWAYLRYVLRHKWYVFVECCKLGIPFRGVIHDLSKFRPSEWFPYVHFFHNEDGTKRQVRDESGYYKPDDTGDGTFDVAWFLHQKRAFHHWQSWCFPDSDGKVVALSMPDKYRRDKMNEDKMRLHPDTRAWIERQLGVSGEGMKE